MDKAVLIYDGECPVCSATAEWIDQHQRPGSFEFLPCQSAERETRYPDIPHAVCMEAMQLVLPDGTVLDGADALPEVFRRLRGLSMLAVGFRMPGAMPLARPFYRWFAGRRYHIARVFLPGLMEKHRHRHSGT
jgi:predicted DCC family thiol-disulfide oxidoreductase YuxK